MGGWSWIWRALPVSGCSTSSQAEGAGRGGHACETRRLADCDDTAEVSQAIQQLRKAALPAPPTRIATARRAAKSFRWTTGQGADTLLPRSFSLVSDDVLSLLIYIMWLAEHCGPWPTQMMAVHIVLLAKPKGGWRPMELLVAAHRVWSS
eukprot:5357284-Pyramimonas_sp.AAC.1